ncbi:MAG: ATP-binding protein, partial [Firmicutes bacterium]|nr:ATP-binding protein [Bacillota bacterium]
MLTKTIAATLEGVEGTLVTVEVDIRRGMPTFTIVGLADTTIKEACSRMKPAVLNSGFDFPDERVTVNLVPAGKPKEGTHFDLPIAVGMITPELGFLIPEDTAFLGELSLDGKLNRIKGALPLVMCLRKQGIKKVILPIGNAEETAILKDVDIMPAEDLDQVIRHIAGGSLLPIYKGKKISVSYDGDLDFSQVVGQETVKRAVVIGAAGNHGLLLMGGPGCGKTMIARRIPTIMPEPTYDEMLE